MAEGQMVPIVRAFLVCDLVIQEEGTGKKTVVGVFDRITTEEFPAAHRRLCVYVRLTDVMGFNRFSLKLVHLESETVVGEGFAETKADDDPLASRELTWNLPAIALPEAGTYEFQLFANDVWIGRTTLTARLKP